MPISIKELKEKIEKCYDGNRYSYKTLTPTVEKDLNKVKFDCENLYAESDDSDIFLGYQTLSNGLTYLGIYAGGDWETPLYFIIYWDGKKLRGYIPEDGNLYNTDTKKAYGNDSAADLKNARKRWPNDESLKEDNIEFECDYVDDYSYEKMIIDIRSRIKKK